MKILVVDDEENIRELLKFTLEKNTFTVREANDGEQALRVVQEWVPDLIILDLMLPEIDGLEVCRRIKSNPSTNGIPIIMLTARAEEIDKILGLELGADDYIAKPFSPREVVARIKAVLRRSNNNNNDGELVLGDLKFNFISYEVYLAGLKLQLTPKEYELLKLFATNIGRVFNREQLLEKVWGYEYYGDTRTVDVHIRHLRAKLEQSKQFSNAIETVRGVGYRFTDIK